jgi:hypothetical protein
MDFVFASISAIMRYSKILEVVLYIYPWTTAQILRFCIFEFLVCLFVVSINFVDLVVSGDLLIDNIVLAWTLYYKSKSFYMSILQGTLFSLIPYHLFFIYTILNFCRGLFFSRNSLASLKILFLYTGKYWFVYYINICFFHGIWVLVFYSFNWIVDPAIFLKFFFDPFYLIYIFLTLIVGTSLFVLKWIVFINLNVWREVTISKNTQELPKQIRELLAWQTYSK